MSVDFKWVTRAYSELYNAPSGRLNYWRNAIFFGEPIDSYRDPGFINYIFTQQIANALPDRECVIADFGCGDGHVIQTVVSQLGQPEDRRVLPIGIEVDGAALRKMKEKASGVQPVRGDLLDVPFDPKAFHAGILRFVLPFIGKDDQLLALKQIHNVLKDGAVLVILNDGVLKESKMAEDYKTLFAECAAHEGFSNMHYLSGESLIVLADKAGFDVEAAVDLTDIVFGYLSPESFARAAQLTPEKRRSLEAVFKACKQENVLPFEPDPDSLRVLHPMYTCVLKKRRSAPLP